MPAGYSRLTGEECRFFGLLALLFPSGAEPDYNNGKECPFSLHRSWDR